LRGKTNAQFRNRRLPIHTEINRHAVRGVQINFFIEGFERQAHREIFIPLFAIGQSERNVARVKRAERFRSRFVAQLNAGNCLRGDRQSERSAEAAKRDRGKVVIDILQPFEMRDRELRVACEGETRGIPIDRMRVIRERDLSFAHRGRATARADFEKRETGSARVLGRDAKRQSKERKKDFFE